MTHATTLGRLAVLVVVGTTTAALVSTSPIVAAAWAPPPAARVHRPHQCRQLPTPPGTPPRRHPSSPTASNAPPEARDDGGRRRRREGRLFFANDDGGGGGPLDAATASLIIIHAPPPSPAATPTSVLPLPADPRVPDYGGGSSSFGGGSIDVGTIPRTINTSWPTWRRRLDTAQDPHNLHKWAGLAWLLSSAGIVGLGSASGFTALPDGLEPVATVFLLSTLVQSLSSIPMALQYRTNEPTVQRGFISSAITSISLALVGYWLSPYAAPAAGGGGPEYATGFVVFSFLADTLFSLAAFRDVSLALTQLQLLGRSAAVVGGTAPQMYADLFAALPLGLPLNLYTLQAMYAHHDSGLRDYVIRALAERGTTVEVVFYTSMLSTVAIGVGNLAATLSHRKLISKNAENLLIVGSIAGVTAFNYRLF